MCERELVLYVSPQSVLCRYGLRYTELISPIIKAIQEIYHKLMGHDEELKELQRKVASLEAENKAKDEKNKELEQRLQNIEKALQENKQLQSISS